MAMPLEHSSFPETPVRQICDTNGWSVKHLIRSTGLSRNVLDAVRGGSYSSVPDKLHIFFASRVSGYSIEEMDAAYSAWQRGKRISANIIPFTETSLKHNPEIHPLASYLEFHKMSMLEFCNELALSKSVIYNYIGNNQIKIPGVLKNALLLCGMPSAQIDLLDRLSREFYTQNNKQSIDEIAEDNGFRRIRGRGSR